MIQLKIKYRFYSKATRPAILLRINAGRANRRDVTQEAAHGLLYPKQGTGAGGYTSDPDCSCNPVTPEEVYRICVLRHRIIMATNQRL